jgi:hypothetical protein
MKGENIDFCIGKGNCNKDIKLIEAFFINI